MNHEQYTRNDGLPLQPPPWKHVPVTPEEAKELIDKTQEFSGGKTDERAEAAHTALVNPSLCATSYAQRFSPGMATPAMKRLLQRSFDTAHSIFCSVTEPIRVPASFNDNLIVRSHTYTQGCRSEDRYLRKIGGRYVLCHCCDYHLLVPRREWIRAKLAWLRCGRSAEADLQAAHEGGLVNAYYAEGIFWGDKLALWVFVAFVILALWTSGNSWSLSAISAFQVLPATPPVVTVQTGQQNHVFVQEAVVPVGPTSVKKSWAYFDM